MGLGQGRAGGVKSELGLKCELIFVVCVRGGFVLRLWYRVSDLHLFPMFPIAGLGYGGFGTARNVKGKDGAEKLQRTAGRQGWGTVFGVLPAVSAG